MKTDNSAYEIQRILDQEIIDSKPHYLIKWKGFSSVESTWQPIENLLHVLDVVHDWKIKNSPHTKKPTKVCQSLAMQIQKNKKIGGLKGHQIKQNQLNLKLDSQRTRKNKKITCISSDQQEDPINLDSSSYKQKQMETTQFSGGQRYTSSRPKRTKPQNPEKSDWLPSRNSKSPKSKLLSTIQQKQQLNGFKVIGKITKEDIKSIVWCFECQDVKICEVLLRDGRKVNMRRDDVKNVCPEKLLEYYEKLQKARI